MNGLPQARCARARRLAVVVFDDVRFEECTNRAGGFAQGESRRRARPPRRRGLGRRNDSLGHIPGVRRPFEGGGNLTA